MKGNIIFYRGAGKLGNMVGYVKGGVQMLRARPEQVANPRTARQELSRAKLSKASEVARGLANVLRVTYDAQSNTRVSARNLFTSQIIPVDADVIHGTTPAGLTVNWEKIPVARGTRSNVGWDEPDLDNPLQVKVAITEYSFSDVNLIKGSDGSDRYVYALFAVHCPSVNGTMYGVTKVYDPADTTHTAPSDITVTVPGNWQGQRVEMYGMICQAPIAQNGIASGTEPTCLPIETSDSVYCGTGIIA